MNVAINAYSAKSGGGKTYLYNLLRHVPEDAGLIYLFCHDDLDVGSSSKIIKVKVRFPVYNPIMRWVWERFVFPKWLTRLNIGILFVPGGVVSSKAPGGCRVVTMFRNMLPFDDDAIRSSQSLFLRAKNWKLKRMMLGSMASADLVIFISDFARRIIEKKIKVKSKVVISHGISEAFLTAGGKFMSPELPFEGKYILYVSRLDFYKRHLELVKAYEALPLAVRDDFKLLLVGEITGSSGKTVVEYVEKNGLKESVYLFGEYPYQKLPALYAGAELFVFVSSCENCPNILLEAMGSGVPTVCSDVEPMPEFGGEAMMYASPDNVKDLSSKIYLALSDESIRKELREKTIARSKLFTWTVTAERTWKAILNK